MAGESTPLGSIIDPCEYLHITINPDGTLTRSPDALLTAPPNTSTATAISRDIPINPSNNTWARIFLPKQPTSPTKLPILLYFHGGGFIIGSPDLAIFHEFCSNIAGQLPVLLVSAGYRLAPEHRLPAAYDDGMEALHWVKTVQDDWLRDHGDYSNCFIMGSSAGGNMAYHVGLRAARETDDLSPLKIKGLILHQPFFGGVGRTESELRLVNDPFLPLCVSDLMWELCLPVGADRDHSYCNPTVGEDSFGGLEEMEGLGWRVLVTGSDGDHMIERQKELVKMMEKKGIKVVGRFGVGDFHGFEFFDSSKANLLYLALQNFIFSHSLSV
ncbi:Carboxylesterase 1 [Hibiscus syriacus]|uniref:Carboxylesterase 1 n=1 Tax=Hibiscus syriacus TaxID=106335 RepID=A0A6A2XJ38_HIBSY|nr:probable carboxylesterase 120 [Hibiscus syriacus]KAE8653804.1 Carboxylesterase 1 [Hibiscus syriacus]